MKDAKMEIIIKNGWYKKDGNAQSTVGIRFEDPVKRCFVGDYEAFAESELTNEEICGAVQRLLMKLLPMVTDAEESVADEIVGLTKGEKRNKFKRNEDGTFSPA